MKTYILSLIVVISFLLRLNLEAQEIVKYKQIDTTELFIEIYYPENLDKSENYPALVFFFGGGWIGGSANQFEPHARHFSETGLVCFLVEYRTANKHKTTPFESLKDAKSAMRFIRKNASRFHIDPKAIIAAGGSAGGHLACATAFIEAYNDPLDDVSVSCKPQALVLFNPVIDNGPGGYGYERIGEAYKDFSPLHNIHKGAPPTIFFLGTEDKLVPVETAEYFKIVMERTGSRCELRLYEGEKHGFFNFGRSDHYDITVREAHEFLKELGYIRED